MRELPRELSAEELAELFEGRTRFVERLAAEPDPLVRARTLVHELPLDEKREILDAHPAIGRRTGLSARSAAEPDPLTRARSLVHELPLDEKREILDAHPAIGQGAGLSVRSAAEQGADADPEILAGLARLNAAYEERHGFRFVVFVNRRPKAAILAVLEDRIENPTPVELETALDELVAIAEDRWARA